MGRDKKTERLAIGVGIALTAGMFSIMPVVYGAPSGGEFKNAGGSIATESNGSGGINTKINSTVTNNVITWNDFSVNNAEKVTFDDGNKTNNYLNIVNGQNTSQISGMITGGNNVYIVNPNGVIIGKGADVNVGNFYVSTRYINPTAVDPANIADVTKVLTNTSNTVVADVVNLGKINAEQVIVEGQNIRFLNSSDVVSSGAVTTRANGYIHIGNSTGDNSGYMGQTLSGTINAPVYYQLINDISKIDTSKTGVNYMLSGNIANAGTVTGTFTGNFDGMGYTVSGLTTQGLFAATKNARIDNLGIVNSTIINSNEDLYLGAVIGTAENTILNHVYNSSTVTSGTESYSGGLIGNAAAVTISNCYNVGNVSGSGLLGYVYDGTTATNTIENSYSTGSVGKGGIAGSVATNKGLTIKNSYASGSRSGKLYTNGTVSTIADALIGTTNAVFSGVDVTKQYASGDDLTRIKVYTDKLGWDISNIGGVSIDESGNVSRPTWRIYEGRSYPILTSMLKGISTVTYDYTQGAEVSASNKGADISRTYNANYLKVTDQSGVFGTDVDTSLITYGTTGIRNVSDGTKALIWTTQNGYDLVGTNATITARKVAVTTDLSTVSLTKEYDGSADASAAVKNLYYGTEDSNSGILAADSADTSLTFTGSATYDSKDVGKDKNITVAGTITITGNAKGNYALYTTDGSPVSVGSGISLNGSATGRIDQKSLVIDFASGKGVGINKTYDGTTVVGDSYQPSAGTFLLTGAVTTPDGNGNTITEDVGVSYDPTANYTGKNAGAYTAGTTASGVAYGGLKLTGATATNYVLKDKTGTVLYDVATNGVGTDINKDHGGTLYGSGTIDRKNISSQGFSWYRGNAIQTASREYDASSAYKDPVNYTVSNSSSSVTDKMLPGDNLSFTVQSADFINSADGTSKTKTKNVSDAKGVLYTVAVSGSDAENYMLDGAALTNTAIVVGIGSITPRTINLAVTDTKAVKTYDGDADIKINDKTSFSLGEAGIAYASGTDTAHHLIDGDDNNILISGKYQQTNGEAAQDVNYSNGAVKDKNVTYTVNVVDAANNASSNYTLVFNAGAGNETKGTTLSVSGIGSIKQKELTGITFDDVSKTYDTKTGVLGDQTTDKITVTGLSGLVGTDTVTDVISTTNIKGDYGKRSGSTFIASADVLRDASNNVMNGDVQYTGVSQSLDGAKAHNYTLGTLSDTQYGRGTINPLTINSADQLTLDRTGLDITKVYDGKADVTHDGVTADSYVDKLYTTVGSTKVYIDYAIDDADYATKNSQNGAKQDVTYKLDVSKGNGNYEIANTALTNGKLEKTFVKSGIITPKDLTATVVNNNVTKTYDATTDVVNPAGAKLTGAELVTLNGLVDGDGTSNATTAAYNSKNAGIGIVTYNLAVEGGEDASNYHFVGAVSNSISGSGTINKRDLTVTAITPQTKVYDGNSDLVATPVAGDFTLSDGTAGNMVLGRDHTALDATKISGQYGSGATDTSFKTSSNVSEVKNVGYSGFKNALGADALQNYNIDDTAYGIGSITKATLSAGDFHFTIGDVARDYDATTHVGTTAGDFVTGHYVTLASGKNADFGYSIDSAEYTTTGTAATVKNVGSGKRVVYTITIDPISFANYKLDSSVTSQMQFNSDTGAINKKAVYASAVSDNLTKTYDGTENLRNGNPTWSGDTATGIELKGDAVIKLDGLVAGDNAVNESTGSYVGTGVGMGNKAINYTIVIDSAHAGNYVIRDARSKTDITTLTTNTNTINPYGLAVNFDSVNRDYNGTTAIDPTLVNPHLSNTLNGDVISLAAGYTANYIDPNVKTVNARPAASVNYDGLKLGGSGAENYTLVNSSGTVLAASTDMTGTQIATGAGTMNKFKLTGNNVTFSFTGPIAKEYDATNVVEYKGATTSEALRNYLQDHYVTLGNGSKQDIVVDMDSVTYDDANHGTGKTVTFKMSLNGDNYDYSDLQDHHIVDDQGKFNAQRTNGEITKRIVYASLTNNPTDSDIVKTYDGTDKVLQDTTGKVIFRDGDLLTSKDGVTLDINTRYADANAGTNKDVYYGLALKGDAASNYEIHDLTKISNKSNDGVISQLAGKGTINKKELTALFDRQEKDYDGNSVVEAKSPILSGLVNNDSLTLDKTRITGKYGTWDALTRQFKEDSNVSRDAAGNVTDKGVYYTGLADALAAGGAIAQNYTIADTVYFDEAAGKGRIKPLTITQAALANWRQVTKEYDATTGVPRDKQKDALSLSVTGTLDDAPIILDYTVKSASYDNQNAGKDHTLSYTISDVNKNLGNYQLSDDAAATIRDTTWTSTADNIITPRTINASLLNDKDVTKVYDGTTSAAAGNLVIDKDDAAVLAKDGLSAVITAEYNDDANATIDPGAAHSNTKTVTYTLGLAASSPNYSISTTTYTATGDIERRTLDVVADPLTVDVGAVMPVSFSGKVNGLITADSDLASGFTFHVDDKVTTSTPGSYGIYGWYNNQRSGQMGQNYVFSQNIGNDKAFTVRLNNPGMEYNNTINPKGQFRPDQTSYQQSSKDQTSSFNGKPEAALEYRDKNGSVLGKTIDSAGSLSIAGSQAADMDSLSQIGISKGNVVNLSSARVANAASVEVDSNGTVVNLEIVPTSAVSSDRQASAAIENAM